MHPRLVALALLTSTACATLPLGHAPASRDGRPGTVQINRKTPSPAATPLPDPVATILDRLGGAGAPKPPSSDAPTKPPPLPGPSSPPLSEGGGGVGTPVASPSPPEPAESPDTGPSPPGPDESPDAPMPTPRPQTGPTLDGVWRITVHLPDASSQYAYYRLDSRADGSLEVNLGEIPQWHADDDPVDRLGWTASRLTFTDGCETLDTGSWCVYYDLDAVSNGMLNGWTIVVGEDGTEFRFQATGHYIGP